MNVDNGRFHPLAMSLLTAAVLATLMAVGAPTLPAFERYAEPVVLFLAYAGVFGQLYQFAKHRPEAYLQRSNVSDVTLFFVGVGIAALAMLVGLGKRPWFARIHLAVLLAAFLGLGWWVLHSLRPPHIDVFIFQNEGATALMAGSNPYAMQHADIYGGHSPYYGDDVSESGKVNVGFPYMPLSLLLVLPAQLMLGDYRWAMLFAMAATAVLIATAVPSRLSCALAALFLFTPRSFFVLHQGWTEPLVLMLLAGTVWSAIRFPRALPILLGLCLATKQTMVLVLPAVWLLLPRPLPGRRELVRFVAITAGVALLVTLPFFLWNPKAFWHDVVTLHFRQPFRMDALSYLAWYAHSTGTRLPTVLGFVAAALGLVLGLGRRLTGPAGFAATVALTLLLFFAFNKQAFCNYYFLTLGSMVLAATVSRPQGVSWAHNPMGSDQGDHQQDRLHSPLSPA